MRKSGGIRKKSKGIGVKMASREIGRQNKMWRREKRERKENRMMEGR